MLELSKSDYRAAKDVLRVGILRLHEAWQSRLAKLLARPLSEGDGNAFDRSMTIIKMARDWNKEANAMEDWYRRDYILLHIVAMLNQSTLHSSDLSTLPPEIQSEILRISKGLR